MNEAERARLLDEYVEDLLAGREPRLPGELARLPEQDRAEIAALAASVRVLALRSRWEPMSATTRAALRAQFVAASARRRPRLLDLMRQAGLSLGELAARLGLGSDLLLQIDRGEVPPPLPRSLVNRLALALGQPRDRLERLLAGPIGPEPRFGQVLAEAPAAYRMPFAARAHEGEVAAGPVPAAEAEEEPSGFLAALAGSRETTDEQRDAWRRAVVDEEIEPLQARVVEVLAQRRSELAGLRSPQRMPPPPFPWAVAEVMLAAIAADLEGRPPPPRTPAGVIPPGSLSEERRAGQVGPAVRRLRGYLAALGEEPSERSEWGALLEAVDLWERAGRQLLPRWRQRLERGGLPAPLAQLPEARAATAAAERLPALAAEVETRPTLPLPSELLAEIRKLVAALEAELHP